jgi:hypothetical protein
LLLLRTAFVAAAKIARDMLLFFVLATVVVFPRKARG